MVLVTIVTNLCFRGASKFSLKKALRGVEKI